MSHVVPDGKEHADHAEATFFIVRLAGAVTAKRGVLDDSCGETNIAAEPAAALLLRELPVWLIFFIKLPMLYQRY